MISQEVGCCGARSWALVIGWFQLICCAIGSLAAILLTIVFAYAVNQQKEFSGSFPNTTQIPANETSPFDILNETYATYTYCFLYLALLIALCFAGVFLGSILICGVKQRNAGKLKAWLIISLIFVIFSLFLNLIYAIEIGGMLWIKYAITLIINLFCLWVVNVHRQELLGLSAGEMIQSNEHNEKKI